MMVHVPYGWKEFRLGELFDFKNGVNTDKSAYGSGYPFANVLEVITNEALTDELIPGRVRLTSMTASRYSVRHGDVLFNRTSETPDEVGLTSVYLGKAPIVFGGFVLRGRPKANELDVGYSKYALRSAQVRQQIVARGQGAIRSNIGQRDLKTVQVVLPPTNEQRSIAAMLLSSDELIVSLNRQIAKAEAMKQGVMQQLLTGKVRLPGVGGEWSVRKLCELGTFLKGRGIKRDDVDTSGIPCIRYGELYTRYHDYTSALLSYVNASVSKAALPIRSGDILFAGSGETRAEIGICVAYLGTLPAVAGGDIIVLRGTGYNPIFLASLANTPGVAQQKARLGQGDAVVHISSRALATIEVNVPSRDEQDAIAHVILDVNREVQALRHRLSKAKAIRHGMMQELLSGRSRILVNGSVS